MNKDRLIVDQVVDQKFLIKWLIVIKNLKRLVKYSFHV